MEYTYKDIAGVQRWGGDQGDGQQQGDPANLRVGDPITVWYNPLHPDVSCYCTPSRNTVGSLITTEITISQLAAIPFAIVISWHGVNWWTRNISSYWQKSP